MNSFQKISLSLSILAGNQILSRRKMNFLFGIIPKILQGNFFYMQRNIIGCLLHFKVINQAFLYMGTSKVFLFRYC